MIMNLINIGVDTTSNTLGIILYHLATNPDKQEELYEEIVKVIGKDGNMSEAALADMRYLKACQVESARLAPTAVGTLRYIYLNISLNISSFIVKTK